MNYIRSNKKIKMLALAISVIVIFICTKMIPETIVSIFGILILSGFVNTNILLLLWVLQLLVISSVIFILILFIVYLFWGK